MTESEGPTEPDRANAPGRASDGADASRDVAGDAGAKTRASAVATGRGDDGTTGLLFGGERIYKDDLRTEAYGTIDEAVAALGLARAELAMKRQYGALPAVLAGLPDLILRIQRELFVAGAELATNPAATDRQVPGQTRVSREMVEGIDAVLAEMEAHISIPREFVVPGETRLSASLEVARTIIRRAERRAVAARRAGLLAGDQLVPYLNRVADLVWILARAAEQGEARPSTPARSEARRRDRQVRNADHRNES